MRGQKSTLTFEAYLQPLPLNISSENNNLGFNSIKKSTFQKMSNLDALGSKFDLDVKQVKVNLGSSFEHTW